MNIELSNIEKSIQEYNEITRDLDDYIELVDLMSEEEIKNIDIDSLKSRVDRIKIASLLDGEYDSYNCYLEIHPGAGGTEACDWASMLLRMYEMFCDKNDYTYKIIEEQKGDEAGIKSATILISGNYPYGYFKGEKGIHRLVRISPFDSGARSHTSFARVSIISEITSSINIYINDTDL